MLRPARLLGRLTSPRRRCTLTGPPVYGRACSNRSLPQPESAITTRPNHLLPRRDSHPFMYQRTKAAPEANEENEDGLCCRLNWQKHRLAGMSSEWRIEKDG